MSFDNAKLRGKIVEVFGTQVRFAQEMGLSAHTMSLKISGKVDWKGDEIVRAAELLSIPSKSIHEYFFTKNSQY